MNKISKISIKYGSNALLMIILVFGILVLINVVLGQKNLQWDLTKAKRYSLSSKTVQVLKSLNKEVDVYAFYKSDSQYYDQVQTLLNNYRNINKKLQYYMIDPDKDPATAKKYGVTSEDTTVFVSGDKQQVVNGYDIAGTDQNQNSVFTGEQQFTQSVILVTEDKKEKAYILQGHGEPNSVDYLLTFRNSLAGEGYDVNGLNLSESNGVPKDCDLLIIANPQKDFSQNDLNSVKNYINNGGKALIMVGSEDGALKENSTNKIVSQWGLRIDNDAVLDPNRSYYMNSFAPVPQYEVHDITDKMMSAGLNIVMPNARSVTLLHQPPTNYTVDKILTTSDSAWGETNYTDKSAVYNEGKDLKGPLVLGAAIKNVQNNMRVVILGDDLMATENVINIEGNKDLLMNCANWLANKTSQIAIGPKSEQMSQVFMTTTQENLVFYSTVIVLPVLFWALGTIIWFRRRAL